MDGLVFADKLLNLVTSADHNSTYKMATAVALMQVAQEQGVDGPDVLATGRLAEVVLELYTRQARYSGRPLRQMNREDQESRILSSVNTVVAAGGRDSDWGYRQAVLDVEDALLAYPLRLLQSTSDQFLFEVPHPTKRSRRAFGHDFDGLLRLRPGVLGLLQRSAPLVRPLVETAWIDRVARYNGVELDETSLRRQMFGYERRPWPRVLRGALEELQHGCFYCGGSLPKSTAGIDDGNGRAKTHVDHFLPWAKTMLDTLENLVLADSACNLRKRDSLPAPALVEKWAARMTNHRTTLATLAADLHWPHDPLRTTRAALVLYQPYERAGPSPAWDGVVSLRDLQAATGTLRQLQADLARIPR